VRCGPDEPSGSETSALYSHTLFQVARTRAEQRRSLHRDVEADLVRIPRKRRSTRSTSQTIPTTAHPGTPLRNRAMTWLLTANCQLRARPLPLGRIRSVSHQLPDPFPTDEKADPAVSTNKLVTTSRAATGSASSIILSSSPEADTQPEYLGQTCPPVGCTSYLKVLLIRGSANPFNPMKLFTRSNQNPFWPATGVHRWLPSSLFGFGFGFGYHLPRPTLSHSKHLAYWKPGLAGLGCG
jgi:hypothetical protein